MQSNADRRCCIILLDRVYQLARRVRQHFSRDFPHQVASHVRDSCPLQLELCRKGCGKQVAVCSKEEHEAHDCSERMVTCECGMEHAFSSKEDHRYSFAVAAFEHVLLVDIQQPSAKVVRGLPEERDTEMLDNRYHNSKYVFRSYFFGGPPLWVNAPSAVSTNHVIVS